MADHADIRTLRTKSEVSKDKLDVDEALTKPPECNKPSSEPGLVPFLTITTLGFCAGWFLLALFLGAL
jgi:hypothetical protein